VDDSYTIARRFEKYRGQYPGIAWAPVAPQPGQTMLFDRLYKAVGERDLHIDIFRPAPTKARDQGIVLVHGGAWRSGTKAISMIWPRGWRGRGYTVFLPEYRLSPEAPYPAGAQDVSDAIAWARAHAGEFGLSGRRIALGGSIIGRANGIDDRHGAGGDAVHHPVQGDARANALIDMDGVLDFTTPGALKYGCRWPCVIGGQMAGAIMPMRPPAGARRARPPMSAPRRRPRSSSAAASPLYRGQGCHHRRVEPAAHPRALVCLCQCSA
jgi:pectinesterase